MTNKAALLASLFMAVPAGTNAAQSAGALFCQPTKGGYNTLAGRVLTNGNLDFAVAEWQPDGQAFIFSGVAKKVGRSWVLKQGRDDAACKITIDWRGRAGASLRVDPEANCKSNAGYGFGSKSVEFRAKDFRRPVNGPIGSIVGPDPCD